MRDAMSVLVRPVVSEKTYALMDRGVYVFIVDPDATRSTCVTPWSRPSACASPRSTP